MTASFLAFLAFCRFLAGLEVKLYSDVGHHLSLIDMGSTIHAQLQEAMPMTDVSSAAVVCVLLIHACTAVCVHARPNLIQAL